MFSLCDLCFMLCSFYLNVLCAQSITGFFVLIIYPLCVGGGEGVEPKLSAISSHSNGNSQQTFLNLLSFVYHHQCNPDFVSWHTLTFDQQTP